jgi:hypothetical protein
VDAVRFLLDNGAQVSAQDTDGATALHCALPFLSPTCTSDRQTDAAADGRPETLALLMERGAPVDAADEDGNTALADAAENGRVACIKVGARCALGAVLTVLWRRYCCRRERRSTSPTSQAHRPCTKRAAMVCLPCV